jgi:hypothetical protein
MGKNTLLEMTVKWNLLAPVASSNCLVRDYNSHNITTAKGATMKRLVEFPLEDGTTMLVEIAEPDQGGLVKASRAGEMIVKAQLSLEKSLEKVKPAAEHVIAQLRKIQDSPDEVQVAFGLKLSADAGAVLASAGAEANYIVTLKWVKSEEEGKPMTASVSRKKR